MNGHRRCQGLSAALRRGAERPEQGSGTDDERGWPTRRRPFWALLTLVLSPESSVGVGSTHPGRRSRTAISLARSIPLNAERIRFVDPVPCCRRASAANSRGANSAVALSGSRGCARSTRERRWPCAWTRRRCRASREGPSDGADTCSPSDAIAGGQSSRDPCPAS